MSRIRVMICRVDDQNPDQMTELASFDMPQVEVKALPPGTVLDQLEATTHEVGHAILRELVQVQWKEMDEALAKEYRQRFSP